MLGGKSAHAQECREMGFVGTDFGVREDLTGKLSDKWRDFTNQWRPYFLEIRPGKSNAVAGLSAGQLWTVSRGLAVGDLILSPTGKAGELYAGEVTGDYYYEPTGNLPHRRPVKWRPGVVFKEELTASLRGSLGFGATVCELSRHSEEIESLLNIDSGGEHDPGPDPAVFGLESMLEEFLVTNWSRTVLGETYDIFTDGDEVIGRQYPTDTGPMDILAISKDQKTLLVVELKRDKASDKVVGQIQRYMGYVLDDVATEGQEVRGVIIALEDDIRIRRALRVAPNIDFYRYEVDFRLLASESETSNSLK
jgi:restriction system protein